MVDEVTEPERSRRRRRELEALSRRPEPFPGTVQTAAPTITATQDPRFRQAGTNFLSADSASGSPEVSSQTLPVGLIASQSPQSSICTSPLPHTPIAGEGSPRTPSNINALRRAIGPAATITSPNSGLSRRSSPRVLKIESIDRTNWIDISLDFSRGVEEHSRTPAEDFVSRFVADHNESLPVQHPRMTIKAYRSLADRGWVMYGHSKGTLARGTCFIPTTPKVT